MNTNYCLPIIKSTKAGVLAKLETAPSDYALFEIWVDYIEDLDHDFINRLLHDYRRRLLFTFRRLNLETPVMELQARLSLLSLISNSDSKVDLDVITQQEELAFIRNNMLKIQVITSYHNYHETPDENKITEIISIMMSYHPEIIKIATKCTSPKDALRLLELLVGLKKEQQKYLILGMGEYGTITRIYGTLWGNEFAFAPEQKEESSAPGQLTKQEMETILNILG